MADVPATELIQPGSRVSRAVLFAGNPSDVEGFREYLSGARKKGERLQSVADASPQIRASSDRAGRFLSLASIVSVLLSAIAVAMAARRYARRHLDSVALMKCMGASQGFVLRQTLLQLVVVAMHRDRVRHDRRVPRAVGPRLAAARSHQRRAAATRPRRLLARTRHGGGDPGRVRASAAAAVEACAARARAAAERRAATAAVRARLRSRDRRGAGAAVLAGQGQQARHLRGARHWRDIPAARGGGMAAGPRAPPAARRRGRRLALWAGQHFAPRPRQRRADRRVRPRVHGAAAARAGAQRPAARNGRRACLPTRRTTS